MVVGMIVVVVAVEMKVSVESKAGSSLVSKSGSNISVSLVADKLVESCVLAVDQRVSDWSVRFT